MRPAEGGRDGRDRVEVARRRLRDGAGQGSGGRRAERDRRPALRRVRCDAQGFPRIGPAGLRPMLPGVRGPPARSAAPPARVEPARRRAVRGARRGRRRRPAAAAARPEGAAAARRGKRELRARGRAARPHPGARVIDLSLLPDGGIAWLDASGPKASIVLSTRIRLARNLQGYVFGQRARDADRTAVLTRVERSEEHTSELQSPCNLVCRLLLEKKKLIFIIVTTLHHQLLNTTPLTGTV